MKWTGMLCAALCAFVISGCSEPHEPIDVKPAADPDDGLVSTDDRADGLSNRYTSIVGAIEVGEKIEGVIDYPDWFHGYTVELEAGDEIRFDLTSGAESIVRLYGPARYVAWNGRPLFARHEVSERMTPTAGSWGSSFVYEPVESGLYLVVTGPLRVWEAKYDIELTCVGGGCAARPGECFSNSDCGGGEICADNGVRCITEPCDGNYDVCQPAPADECTTAADCPTGFCRFANDARTHMECVPHAEEGDSCGGFVVPHMIEVCDPSLDCVARPFVADVPGICRHRTTVSELRADPTTLLGQRVVIDGEVGHGLAYCTRLACVPEDPCCNSCGAGQVIADSAGQPGIDLKKDGSSFGCSGDECDITRSCDLQEGPTRVVGTLERTDFGELYFEVETVTWLGTP